MARKASEKPWFHSSSGFWCATVNGKREYLDKDYGCACRKLRQLKQDAKRQQAGVRDWLNEPFAVLADEYLADIKARRKQSTYVSCKARLLRALKILGTRLCVGELRKLHLAKIERKMIGKYSSTTIKDTLVIVSGVLNWAVKHDCIEINPLVGFDMPAARRRHRIIKPEEFQALLRSSDSNFRRVLISLRLTGCRPGEVRTLLWEWVDLERGLWISPDHKSITQQRHPHPRVVPLPRPVLKMCHWLAHRPHNADDHVFLNRHGRPYSKDCLVTKMSRTRRRAGIDKKAGEQIVMYSSRHSFSTDAVGKVADTELAELMGHTDTSMLRRYVHFNADRLCEIQRRLQS